MPKCPQCGSEVSADTRFCRECGTRLPLFCPRCGSANNEGVSFCNSCGYSFKQQAAIPITQQETQKVTPVAPTPPPTPTPATPQPAASTQPTARIPAQPRPAAAASMAQSASQRRRRGSRKGLYVLGCLVLLVGMLASIACVALVVLPYVQKNESLLSRFQGTGLVRLSPTPTARLISPTLSGTPVAASGNALPEPIKLGSETLVVKSVILSEDFAKASKGWKEERVEGLYKTIANGQYNVELRGKNVGASTYVLASDSPLTSDFVLKASAHATDGPKLDLYGIGFGNKSGSEYYQFEISDVGQYRIRYIGPSTGPKGQTLRGWQAGPVATGTNVWNTLAIVRRAKTLSFYLNGLKLFSFDDTHNLSPGVAGIYAGAYDEPSIYAFDNVYLGTLQ